MHLLLFFVLFVEVGVSRENTKRVSVHKADAYWVESTYRYCFNVKYETRESIVSIVSLVSKMTENRYFTVQSLKKCNF